MKPWKHSAIASVGMSPRARRARKRQATPGISNAFRVCVGRLAWTGWRYCRPASRALEPCHDLRVLCNKGRLAGRREKMTNRRLGVVLALAALSTCHSKSDEALLNAVMSNNFDAARKLIADGADVNHSRSEHQETMIIALAGSTDTPALKFLVEEAKADVNAKTALKNQTALMWAAKMGRIENVRILAAAGADLNAAGSDGQTAVSVAKANNFTEIAQ